MNKTFNTSTNEEITSDEDSSSAKPAKELPAQRGPIKLSGTWWMQIGFVPWMVVWIWGSITGGWLPLAVATGFSLLLLLYHGLTNKPVLFEIGTSIYMTLALLAFGLNWSFFMLYHPVIDYLVLAGLWAGSAINHFTLTAEYSGQGYPVSVLKTKAFVATNLILSTSWGVYFIIAGFMTLMEINGVMLFSFPKALMILRFVLLAPMFIFTAKFQKWYPKYLLKNK